LRAVEAAAELGKAGIAPMEGTGLHHDWSRSRGMDPDKCLCLCPVSRPMGGTSDP